MPHACSRRIMPLQIPDSFEKNRKIYITGTASSCDFLREKVRTSGKTSGNSVKNYPFSAGNAQNGGVLKKKSGIFVFFGVLGLSGLRILLSHFWPAPLQRLKGEKKSSHFFFRPPMGPNPRQTTFYRNRN